jgi:hypothetical protein
MEFDTVKRKMGNGNLDGRRWKQQLIWGDGTDNLNHLHTSITSSTRNYNITCFPSKMASIHL